MAFLAIHLPENHLGKRNPLSQRAEPGSALCNRCIEYAYIAGDTSDAGNAMIAGDTHGAFTDAGGKTQLLTHFLISFVLFRIDLLTTSGQALQLILQFRYLELELLNFITHNFSI